MKKITAIALLALGILSGCAQMGNRFDINAASSFVPGETTYAEAVQALGGEPTASKVREDGTKVYRWLWSRAGVGYGGADRIDLLFDSNGLFIREESRSSL